jgi:hypothetical protein
LDISCALEQLQGNVGQAASGVFWRNAALVKTALVGMAETTPVATGLCYDLIFNGDRP